MSFAIDQDLISYGIYLGQGNLVLTSENEQISALKIQFIIAEEDIRERDFVDSWRKENL